MLDDLKYIHEKDGQDALGIAEKQWQQLENNLSVTSPIDYKDIQNIVLTGMGGSALSALLFKSWPKINLPFEISKDYSLPDYVNDHTLVIASSYSGNTEETLSALSDAKSKNAKIAILTTGGKLLDIATTTPYPHIVIKQAGQPRFAALGSLNALVLLLSSLDLIPSTAPGELESAGNFLKTELTNWIPTVSKSNNLAKQIAYDVVGSSIVVYAGPFLYPAAYKWKISFNENAKNVAWCNQYPEFNHNEFLGWTSHPIDKPYKVIDLQSSFDNPQVKKRFELSNKLLSGRRPSAITVQAKGNTQLEQLLYTVALGDFVSLYTALLNGLNPTPVDLIEKFKKELSSI